MVVSGCGGNYAISEAVRPSGALDYDELVHGSIMDGISRSPASTRLAFVYTDIDTFCKALITSGTLSHLSTGKNSVLVVIDDVHS